MQYASATYFFDLEEPLSVADQVGSLAATAA